MHSKAAACSHLASLLGIALALSACGPDKTAPPPQQPPPQLPPSMLAQDPQTTSAASDPTAGPEVQRGTHALEQGDLVAAQAAFQDALKKDPKDALALYYTGVVDEKQGDKTGAEKAYKAALGVRPDLEAAAVNLGAYYVDAGRVDEAITVLRASAAKHQDSAPLALNLAVALAAKGDKDGATKSFEDATRLAPKDPMTLLTYAQWLGKWGRNDDALTKLRAAVTKANDDVGVLASIGFEMKNVGAFPDCVAVLDSAIQKKEAAELRTYRALCKLGLKDKAGARADLDAAVKNEPNFAPAHFYLGGRFAEAQDWKSAAREYDTYLKIEPNGPLAKPATERSKIAKQRASGGK